MSAPTMTPQGYPLFVSWLMPDPNGERPDHRGWWGRIIGWSPGHDENGHDGDWMPIVACRDTEVAWSAVQPLQEKQRQDRTTFAELHDTAAEAAERAADLQRDARGLDRALTETLRSRSSA